MNNINSILVPTDFSTNTQTALDYAIDLANQFSCKLILFNTYKLAHRAGMFIGVERLMRDESREQMAELLKKTRKRLDKGVVLEGKVAKGEAISTVIRAAVKLEVSMIVMGTQGATGLKGVFIGSTTNGVMVGSRVPVLVVPSKFEYRPLRTIALPIDDNAISADTSLESLRMIVLKYNAKICTLHIGTKDESKTAYIKNSLAEILDGIAYSYKEVEADDDGVNQKINKFMEEEEADLLCMIKRDRGFWGNLFHSSITTKEVFDSSVPILVLYD